MEFLVAYVGVPKQPEFAACRARRAHTIAMCLVCTDFSRSAVSNAAAGVTAEGPPFVYVCAFGCYNPRKRKHIAGPEGPGRHSGHTDRPAWPRNRIKPHPGPPTLRRPTLFRNAYLRDPKWRKKLTDADRRGLSAL